MPPSRQSGRWRDTTRPPAIVASTRWRDDEDPEEKGLAASLPNEIEGRSTQRSSSLLPSLCAPHHHCCYYGERRLLWGSSPASPPSRRAAVPGAPQSRRCCVRSEPTDRTSQAVRTPTAMMMTMTMQRRRLPLHLLVPWKMLRKTVSLRPCRCNALSGLPGRDVEKMQRPQPLLPHLPQPPPPPPPVGGGRCCGIV